MACSIHIQTHTVAMTAPTREGVLRYDNVAVTLHWLIAALLLAQLFIGFTFSGMERGDARTEVFAWHRTLGFATGALMLLRLGWRLVKRPPPFPAETRAWERVASRIVHLGLYAVLLALPLTGWIYVSTGSTAAATGVTTLIGGIPFPILPGLPSDWHGPSARVHKLLVLLALALMLLHVAAAMKNRWFDKARLANRMPPFRVRGRD